MRKDLIKSTAGLLVIGIIILATFLYGSKQRQDQVRRDQDAKTAQEQKASPAVSTSTGTTDQAPSGGTAAVHAPVANELQNPATAAVTKPQAPVVATQPKTTPQTGAGSGLVAVLGLATIAALYQRHASAPSRLRAAALRV
jgi:uncharacterized membrane protein